MGSPAKRASLRRPGREIARRPGYYPRYHLGERNSARIRDAHSAVAGSLPSLLHTPDRTPVPF